MFSFIFSYASTFDFGHYSRLEQLQKRLWYFSYFKYPISSIYHLLTTSLQSISSSDQPSIVYSRPCSGCLRCQPTLVEQYHASQQQQSKTSYFSRVYQSNRSIIKPVAPEVSPPIENPECGIEYCIDTKEKPIELRAKTTTDEHSFQVDISDQFERFNYDQTKYPTQSVEVQYIRFKPNINLIGKQMLINHEKFDMKTIENELNPFVECRIELSEQSLKFIQINPDLSLTRETTKNELEEETLEKTGIFLFPRRSQHIQSS